MQDQLVEFFDSPFRCHWLKSEHMQVYVRKGLHLGSDGNAHRYLDVANVTVDPEFQHQGIFKAFLSLCQELQPYDGIKLENVLNENLCAYIRNLALSDSRWHENGAEISPDFLWENYREDCQDWTFGI